LLQCKYQYSEDIFREASKSAHSKANEELYSASIAKMSKKDPKSANRFDPGEYQHQMEKLEKEKENKKGFISRLLRRHSSVY